MKNGSQSPAGLNIVDFPSQLEKNTERSREDHACGRQEVAFQPQAMKGTGALKRGVLTFSTLFPGKPNSWSSKLI